MKGASNHIESAEITSTTNEEGGSNLNTWHIVGNNYRKKQRVAYLTWLCDWNAEQELGNLTNRGKILNRTIYKKSHDHVGLEGIRQVDVIDPITVRWFTFLTVRDKFTHNIYLYNYINTSLVKKLMFAPFHIYYQLNEWKLHETVSNKQCRFQMIIYICIYSFIGLLQQNVSVSL